MVSSPSRQISLIFSVSVLRFSQTTPCTPFSPPFVGPLSSTVCCEAEVSTKWPQCPLTAPPAPLTGHGTCAAVLPTMSQRGTASAPCAVLQGRPWEPAGCPLPVPCSVLL